ncbi:MAG: 8-amino-7-oxononanoate synthase [Planctomycetales bacterium]|nr:8-amino-7-oxononanoate synthase [Planctomycetales bacterium]
MKQLTSWLREQHLALQRNHIDRQRRTIDSSNASIVRVDGVLCQNFASNDYLDFSRDKRIKNAVVNSLNSHTWGAAASPLIAGRTDLHESLEREIATFKETEAAMLFPTGYATNVGTISALMGAGDTVFSDQKNHASIIDGCRLSRATTVVYPHCDMDALRTALQRASLQGKRLIVTDSLFSMDGDIPPLPTICEIAEEYGASVMVDEAHATGVFGSRGSGLAEQLNCHHRVAIQVGTLSKAVGSLGGFVAGSQELVDWLFNRARSYVFSTSPPPALCAAALCALKLITDEPFRRIELLEKAERFREMLAAEGFSTGDSHSQIVPIRLGEPQITMRWSDALLARGFLVPGIRPPTVPRGESMLRVCLSWAHQQSALDGLVKALCDLRETDPLRK